MYCTSKRFNEAMMMELGRGEEFFYPGFICSSDYWKFHPNTGSMIRDSGGGGLNPAFYSFGCVGDVLSG